MGGQFLAEQGHVVVLHARSEARAEDARASLPQAEAVLLGDVSTLDAMRSLANQANRWGRFDVVIHNVGIGYRELSRVETSDGLSQLWAVNVLAPYALTALMHRPDRLIYLTSGMHLGADPSLDDPQWSGRHWSGAGAYSESKLHDLLLTFGVARRWPDVPTNAVSPGWVQTRMGGAGAPDDLAQSHLTQAWLAAGDDPLTRDTGGIFYHKRPTEMHPAARETKLQDRLLDYCREVSGIALD
jgi:NAD(P)-dependent dehydrogenase (short-subunit alcohol dehydrogenase family)